MAPILTFSVARTVRISAPRLRLVRVIIFLRSLIRCSFFFFYVRIPNNGQGPSTMPGSGGKSKSKQGKSVRLNINARERRRMHDLNDALDELRSVIPYAHSPSVRKLSKIATLLLAKNYILMQANALEELRRLITYIQVTVSRLTTTCLNHFRYYFYYSSPAEHLFKTCKIISPITCPSLVLNMYFPMININTPTLLKICPTNAFGVTLSVPYRFVP